MFAYQVVAGHPPADHWRVASHLSQPVVVHSSRVMRHNRVQTASVACERRLVVADWRRRQEVAQHLVLAALLHCRLIAAVVLLKVELGGQDDRQTGIEQKNSLAGRVVLWEQIECHMMGEYRTS